MKPPDAQLLPPTMSQSPIIECHPSKDRQRANYLPWYIFWCPYQGTQCF